MSDEKKQFYDTEGRPLTQSLFLEIGYNLDYAIYTFKPYDHHFKGKDYKSIRQLYLDCADITEYEFASKYFIGWHHWKRICENKLVKKQVAEWREELEIRLRCQGVKAVIANARKGGYQAALWLTKRGWDNRAAGRPSSEDIEKEKKFQARAMSEFSQDAARLYKDTPNG